MRRLIIAIGAALLGSGSTKRMEGENKYNEGLRLFYGEGELEKGIAALRDFVEDSNRRNIRNMIKPI